MSETATREAAERVLQWMGPNPPEEPYDMPIDAETVCLAWLAEHPADSDVAITEDWLRRVGFAEVESDLGPRYSNHFEIVVPLKGAFNIWTSYDEWLISGFDSFPFKTRGDLRLLCRALGIALPSPPEAGE